MLVNSLDKQLNSSFLNFKKHKKTVIFTEKLPFTEKSMKKLKFVKQAGCCSVINDITFNFTFICIDFG